MDTEASTPFDEKPIEKSDEEPAKEEKKQEPSADEAVTVTHIDDEAETPKVEAASSDGHKAKQSNTVGSASRSSQHIPHQLISDGVSFFSGFA